MSAFTPLQKHYAVNLTTTQAQTTAVFLFVGFGAQAGGMAFGDLTSAALVPVTPDIVVAPLISSDFDALDLLDRLSALNYRGRLRLVSPKLPNRQIVLRELRSVAFRAGIAIELTDAA